MDRQQRKPKAVSTPKVPFNGGTPKQQSSPYGLSSSSSNSSQPDSVSCVGDIHGYESPESSLSTVTTSSSNLSVFPSDIHSQPQQQPVMSTFQRSSFVPNQRAFMSSSSNAGGAAGMVAPAGPASYVRQSYHSSSSSIASADRSTADSICSIDVNEMILTGVPDLEILNVWLSSINLDEYYSCFAASGYDMQTISRMTPEDLTAVGIQKPNHRKKLKQEISRLNLHDGTPDYVPASLDEWLHLVRLSCYSRGLKAQGYDDLPRVCEISVEDLEDVGIFKLGHQKRFLIAVKKLKQALKSSGCRQVMSNNSSASSLPPSSARIQYSPTRVTNSNFSPRRQQQSSPLHVPMPLAPPMLSMAAQQQQHQFQQHQFQLQQQQQQQLKQLQSQQDQLQSHQEQLQSQQQQQQPVYCPEVIPISNDSKLSLEPMPLLSANANSYLPSTFSTLPSAGIANATSSHFNSNSLGRPGSAMKQIPVAKVSAVTRPSNNDNLSQAGEKKEGEEEEDAIKKPCAEGAAAETAQMTKEDAQKLKGNGRNAGDVLNDIGSMLADLTDELDSMLHAEHNN